MDGIINLNKEKGCSSHDCVAAVRRLLDIRKAGHTGTLDPMAEGVLPVCVGRATRIMEYLDCDIKKYRCRMILGTETDTQDIWGNVTERKSPEGVTEAQIKDVLFSFIGEISQIPPIYSALKVRGRRLYKYARAGQEVEIKPRKIRVTGMTLDFAEGNEAGFTVECSRGTYVRTICHDAGRMLGCGAAMSALTRLASGIFRIEDSVTLRELEAMDTQKRESAVLPVDFPLTHFGRIILEKDKARDFVNGKALNADEITPDDISGSSSGTQDGMTELYNIYFGKEFLGVGELKSGIIKADKVFNTRMQNEDL